MVTEQVRRQIEEYGMIQAGDVVVVGLSGGADSVCLLSVLKKLSPEYSFSMAAIHVHHGIRGAEADKDAAFCERLCKNWSIPFEKVYVDVPMLAAANKQSLEEAGRQERYRQLELYRQRIGGRRIAVAHHRDDQAETVLWNLLRGSGLRGLAGMEPVNGAVIRPLLRTARSEIILYMKEQGLEWQEDATNGEDYYTRNRLRRHIMEYAVQNLNRQAAKHICQTADMASEADAYLCEQAGCWLLEYSQADRNGQDIQRISLDINALQKEPRILQRYIVREALSRCRGQRDLELCHVDAALSLIEKRQGRSASARADLGGGYVSRRTYGILTIEKAAVPGKKTGGDICREEKRVNPDELMKGSVRFQIGGEKLELRVFPRDKTQKIPTNQYTKWLDYDKIKKSLVFRFRRSGDYFLLPDGRKKTVKTYMIDEKIPSEEREHILVAAEGSHVLWIAGRRLCAGVKISEHTKQILQIMRYGGREDGEDSCIDS